MIVVPNMLGAQVFAQARPVAQVSAAGEISKAPRLPIQSSTPAVLAQSWPQPVAPAAIPEGSFTWIKALTAMLLAGLLAGFAAGLFGIGGGFVVVPALFAVLPLMGGDPAQYAHVAIGTSAATIIVTSIRSVSSHAKRGAVDFDILKSWAPWVVLGDVVGVLLAGHVNSQVLTLIFAIGVLLMSINFLVPTLSKRVIADEMPQGVVRAGIAGGLGAFSSVLGIGGGTIAIIVMTLCGRPIHKAVATASGIGTLIAIPSAIGFAFIGFHDGGLPWGSVGYVNIPAALAVASMSLLTAPLGVAAAHSLPTALLKRSFGIYLVLISGLMVRNSMGMVH